MIQTTSFFTDRMCSDMNLKYILLITGLCLATLAPAKDLDDADLIVELNTMKEARKPYQWKDWTVFTYKPDSPVRYVNAVFAHEDFKDLHEYKYNKNGVFILVITTPEKIDNIDYRIVVDGIWTNDPNLKSVTRDKNKIALSRFNLKSQKTSLLKTPLSYDDGKTVFIMKTEPGSRVNLVGSFNQWDPFMMPLKELTPGYYELALRLPQGDYHYYYTIDGHRFIDFYNPSRVYDNNGREYSSFSIN